MALSLAYINEVLNHTPCTVVVTETQWPELLAALKFEGRKLDDLILGQMRLRWAPGGYEGLMARVEELTTQRDALQGEVDTLKTRHAEPAREPEALTPA